MTRRFAFAIIAAIGIFTTGCDHLVALCNATGAAPPNECEARWSGR